MKDKIDQEFPYWYHFGSHRGKGTGDIAHSSPSGLDVATRLPLDEIPKLVDAHNEVQSALVAACKWIDELLWETGRGDLDLADLRKRMGQE